jgi:hypothetical protein
MRFMPIEQTCFAGKDEIAKAATELIAKHFPKEEGVAPIKVLPASRGRVRRAAYRL